MKFFDFSIAFSAILFFQLGLATDDSYSDGRYYSRCRCLPTDSCWPTPSEWASFNTSVSGSLIAVKPVASPCHDPTFDQAACEDAKTNYNSSAWRGSFPGGYQQVNFETSAVKNESCYPDTPRSSPCGQGNVPVYAVAATSPAQIQKAVDFARERNLRLVIKNSGHDYLGRSAGRGSLQIWTHNMKSIEFSDSFTPETCTWKKGEEAVTIGAGVQLKQLYSALKDKGKTAVIGLANTVGAAGGYIQGGGHSPLGPWKGMASDNAYQFTIVTADSKHITANECQNSDLFWALRGGGGGTFGVVTSVTIRTFPDANIVVSNLNATIPDRDQFYSFIADFHAFLPKFDDAGGSGYYYIFHETNSVIIAGFSAGQSNPNATEALFAPLVQKARAYPNSKVDWAQLGPFPISIGVDISLTGTDVTGGNTLLASRLVSRKFLESTDGPKRLSEALKALGPNQNTIFIGHIVAGGQVARNKGIDSALNPSWRKALTHIVFTRGWETSTSFAEQAVIARNMTDVETPILAALEPEMGAYINEADLNEKRWQKVFWGENYDRLLRIKAKWDGKELFMCKPCIGSENWDAESICRK
ncbi:FAD-binding domain-containing protein [Choiromyces venosus 120613-1]|uniref:FAD-binding domain-containing protein n=1 Tax=Choiromyces venosus 120613-1 TaxID=1336337 RepID=A0A3N4JGF1_9PEZI|nr:FAD-binding domain-containing protein [Choiromyces venosus 120613-1]